MSEEDTLSEFGTSPVSQDKVSPNRNCKSETAEEPMDTEEREFKSLTQWASVGPDTFLGIAQTNKTLPSGVYNVINTDRGIFFEKVKIFVDEFLEFPDSKTDKILKEIEFFWKQKDVFKHYGFLHRRGFLLYGPAGSGKTVLVQQVIARIIKSDGVVFLCDRPGILSEALQIFRRIEPNRQAVCVFEDIDAIITHHGDDDLLSLLDGENQVDQVLNIATTNYPERLDRRIVSRPRRFDRVLKVGMPTEAVRSSYFKHKLKIKDEELKKWVDATDGFSFAAMAELVISVKCLNHTFEDAIATMKNLLKSKVSSEDYEGERMGFHSGGR